MTSPTTDRTSLCPTDVSLYRFSMGDGASVVFDEIAAHVTDCPSCLARLEQFGGCDDAPPEAGFEQERGFQELVIALQSVSPSSDLSGATLAVPPPDFCDGNDGRTQVGHYDLGSLLGEGAMGSVYRGWHRLLKREVVVKLLSPQRRQDDLSVMRFLREIEAVGRIGDHPHIARAMDAGQHEGDYYIVMEYVAGIDLRHVAAWHGPLATHDVAAVGVQVSLALEHIRKHRIVHRDVKPSNLFLTRDGMVQLIDLGLAHFQRRTDEHGIRSHVVGTADYIAPEQWTPQEKIDCRADIYSLGCTLYQLWSGAPPFASHRGFSHKRQAHLQLPPPTLPPATLPIWDDPTARDLAAVIQTMLAKDPAARYQTPGQVVEALKPLATQANLRELVEKTLDRSPMTLVHYPEDDSRQTLLDASPLTLPSSTLPTVTRRTALASVAGLGAVTAAWGTWGVLRPKEQPGFRPLFAANPDTPITFTYLPEQQLLRMYYNHFGGLAWSHAPQTDSFAMHAKITKETGTGDAGFFWGSYQGIVQGVLAWHQHLLAIAESRTDKRRMVLQHSESNVAFIGQKIQFSRFPMREVELPERSESYDLLVRIAAGRLAEVRCNEVELTGLADEVDTKATSLAQGSCGVFVNGCAANVSRFVLKEAT